MKKLILIISLVLCIPTTTVLADDGGPATTVFNHDITPPNNLANWETKHNRPLVQSINAKRQITYQIKTPVSLYQQAYQQAIGQWNQLNVIELVPTKRNPQIELGGKKTFNYNVKNDGNTQYAVGKIQRKKNNTYQFIIDARVTMRINVQNTEPVYLLKYTTFVAEHEIGHALGFGHDNAIVDNEMRVMNYSYNYEDVNNVLPIGTYEQQRLLQHYQYQFK